MPSSGLDDPAWNYYTSLDNDAFFQSAFFCFLVSVVFLLTALAAYGVATRTEFYQYYVGEGEIKGEVGCVQFAARFK